MPEMLTDSELENRFTYHAPKEGQTEKYELLRNQGKQLAQLLVANVPSSRELMVAITKLEEAIFWANAGIARNE
jgi:hypothetical protein